MTTDILLPRVLLTNDDGFDAPGLTVLADAIAPFAKEIWIVAPTSNQSGVSQKISINDPVRIHPKGEQQWAIDGTPSDAVAIAVSSFMEGAPPSLVISGVNPSCNIGDEVNISGTIGAAMTALGMGIPAIAISQDGIDSTDLNFETTKAILPKILEHVLSHGWRKETVLSINIPTCPPEEISGCSWSRQGRGNVVGYKTESHASHRSGTYFFISLLQEKLNELEKNERTILDRKEVSLCLLSSIRDVDTDSDKIWFHEPPAVVKEDSLALDEMQDDEDDVLDLGEVGIELPAANDEDDDSQELAAKNG